MVGGWRLEFGESAKTKRKKEIALACEDSPCYLLMLSVQRFIMVRCCR